MNEPVSIGEKLSRSITEAEEIRLSYKDFRFSIGFAALDYTWPDSNRYAYKMDGLTEEWVLLGNERKMAFTGLSPGAYVFRVRACNNDNVWNETGRSLRIYITPPFWRTWWAYGGYLLIFFMIIITVHKLRVRHLKKRRAELVLLVSQRTEELAEAYESLKGANTEIIIINENLRHSMQELSRSNQELKDANKLKSDFLGIAAHDLKNPLQVILGYTHLLKLKMEKNGDACKEVEIIDRSVAKMLNLISELLQTATMERGKLRLNLSEVDVTELAETVVRDNKPIATQKRQRMRFFAKKDFWIIGDKRLIVQVIENLVSNAVKYSPLGKAIWVSVEEGHGEVVFKIRDEGPGFTTDDKKHLFKQFQRCSAKPTAGESSTGLGLSICKGFVELHGGRIEVESKEGTGSTFIVHLPFKPTGNGDVNDTV